MKRKNKKRIIVVLGMHRSGTSAITRGLQALGVDLGESLMPPASGNEKGFFEDVEINQLNIELLNAINSDWHKLSPIPVTVFAQEGLSQFKLRAIELIRARTGNQPFGMKDPRIARLLPFWQAVFDHIGIDVSYVIAVRNPMSIVKSLKKRDGFDAEKSYYLWLEHMLPAILKTQGAKRVAVNYDLLMADPQSQLKRIAQTLDLPFDQHSPEVQEYNNEFIDVRLRHARFELEDLRIDPTVPKDVIKAYELLIDFANDRIDIDAPEIVKTFKQLNARLHDMAPVLRYIALFDDKIAERDGQITGINQKVSEQAEQIGSLNQSVTERDGQIASLTQAVAERDGQIVGLNQSVAERDGQITGINQKVSEQAEQIGSLKQTVTKRDKQIVSLDQAVVERDKQNADINRNVSEQAEQIGSLNQSVTERDGQIASLTQAVAKRDELIHQLFASTSWRLTRPLRAIKSFFTGKEDVEMAQKKPICFDAEWYLKRNPDVAMSDMDPYEHYIHFGENEDRQPAPDPFLTRNIRRLQVVQIALRVAIRESGGVKPTVSKLLAILKRKGWSGVKDKIISLHARAHALKLTGFDRSDYTEWIRRYDTLTDEKRKALCLRYENFSSQPHISVVMPTYNPKPEWLVEAIESVRNQIYPHWELCIADDASTDKAIRPILERYAREDSRIKVVYRKQNGHISAASNSALELAAGEWVALLDHDDLLTEHALFWVADSIKQNPELRLIYSDEDKIDEKGKRFDPYFKCDWNLNLFYSHNLITHLGVYRLDLLRDINGFREGLEGAQDYDLALRCIERIEARQIHHIPRVLYHWRMHAESTAQSADAKPYAMLAGERALNEHFLRKKINATSELVGYGYRTHYALPDSPPMVSLIIPTRNGLQLLQQCIESILKKTTYPNYEILIIDNGSDDRATLKYLDELHADTRVRVLRDDRPFNYSALNNAAVKFAQGEVLGLLNNDLEVISPEWLSEMVSIALQPGVGAVGARLWYPNDTLQHGGVVIGLGGVAGHSHKNLPLGMPGYTFRAKLIQEMSAVTAACLVIRKEIYEQVDGLNEVDLQIAFNDVDFCLRVRAAVYRNIWTPFAELYHHESATRGFEDTQEKQARFAKEVQYMKECWGEQLLNDPAYSPNLTLDHEDFSLAWPPRVELIQ